MKMRGDSENGQKRKQLDEVPTATTVSSFFPKPFFLHETVSSCLPTSQMCTRFFKHPLEVFPYQKCPQRIVLKEVIDFSVFVQLCIK